MQWQGESGLITEARRDGWDGLDGVLDGEGDVRRRPLNPREIELDVLDPESGTEWHFGRDVDGQWWAFIRRGGWNWAFCCDVSNAVAYIADQLVDLKKDEATKLVSAADPRQLAHELRAAESAVT